MINDQRQSTIVVMDKYGNRVQKGPGPYPGVTCCLCFEIKCGLQVLAIIAVVGGIGQIVYACFAFTYGPSAINDWKLTTFIIIMIVFGLVGTVNVYFQARWLVKDDLKTRLGLVFGYKVAIAVFVLLGLW